MKLTGGVKQRAVSPCSDLITLEESQFTITLRNRPITTQDARKILHEAKVFDDERKLVGVGGMATIGVPVSSADEKLVRGTLESRGIALLALWETQVRWRVESTRVRFFDLFAT